MLYSVYNKWIVNKEGLINFDEAQIYNDWVVIGSNLTLSEVKEIISNCNQSKFADDYIQVILPELNIGDKVMNIKNNQIGTVIYFDQNPITGFDNININDDGIVINKKSEFITIRSESETLVWELQDLIVVNEMEN